MQIDAVITWVDGEDEVHQQKILPFLEDKKQVKNKGFRTRFDQVEEIKYTVNSILKYATFIRNIYIVTDNQIPNFLKNQDENQEKYKNVFIINHTQIFKEDSEFLPVFNCRPIETKLYNIPNLSEHFIYFNDDMFLLRKVEISDFFIDGKPVIRGKWLKFNENIFYKRLFNSDKKKKRAGHKKAQEKSAKLVGFKKYYKFHHVPYALRKSTFLSFFKENKGIERLNIKHKFRNADQYTPQGLANHIEIKNKTAVLKSDYQLIYFQNYKKIFFWLKFKLNNFTKKENKLFLNMQSLDQAPKEKLAYILNWLDKKYN
ncbi:Stealth CR1 domain-containing protein [Tenacibaculum piscium]|uniref:Stealth CR1 domain-containing protein n=1 Tax=Tenacibaculum piscium TaxID=1458515 RepID=UPI001EFB8FE1|nr:Stealth CR1 domain-containing protein [Tenacibaculum piscium]MCG8184102.1 Stealth CR1 domain-containing protein [Tenacibaculum piscium]MCG8205495.1 Stealth CR1 domain-containing protein [Tenacibaculum piscium]